MVLEKGYKISTEMHAEDFKVGYRIMFLHASKNVPSLNLSMFLKLERFTSHPYSTKKKKSCVSPKSMFVSVPHHVFLMDDLNTSWIKSSSPKT